MDGDHAPAAASSLDDFADAHPEIDICQVEGIWRAWIRIGDTGGGAELYGPTEAELLGKLTEVTGG